MKGYDHTEKEDIMNACGLDMSRYSSLMLALRKEVESIGVLSKIIQRLDELSKEYDELRRVLCLLAFKEFMNIFYKEKENERVNDSTGYY